MSECRHAPSQRLGGVPSISHSRRALCRANMWSLVIYGVGRECGSVPPRIRCSVVDIAKVPQDQGDRG